METICRQPVPSASTDETHVRLDAILATAVDAIITIDSRGRIETFNRAAEAVFGYRAHEIVGHNISALMPDPHATRHDDGLRVLQSKSLPRVIGRTREILALHRDGHEFPIELALSAAKVGGRQVYTGIIRDVSRRKAAEQALQSHRNILERRVIDRTAALEAANRRLEISQVALRRANARLRKLIRIDELTGIGNRRAFDERLAVEWRRQLRDGQALSVIICDVDLFKRYNDHYGHPAGDACLRLVAETFDACFQRASEFAARYGGEEFAAILANTDIAIAQQRAEVVRQKIQGLAINHGALGPGRVVTVSLGVAGLAPSLGNDQLTLIEAADEALYRAKRGGRNRVDSV